MKIIALDSSGLVASVAIVCDGVTIAEYTLNYKKTHSQTLLPMLDEIKSMTELDLSTVDAIALAAGPGSFTGLRIGSATAKGLGLALNIPIIPVPTVDALAYNLYGCGGVICPLMDARRNQVYTGLYAFEKGELVTIEPQCAVDVSKIIDKVNSLGRDVYFLGDGVPVYREKIEELIMVGHFYAPASCNRQRAACVAALGERLYMRGISQSAAEHKPEYLRLSQAERQRFLQVNISKMQEGDLDTVTALEASCFSMPWRYKDFEEVLSNPHRFYLVAKTDEGKIVGGCMLTEIAGEGDITNVAVLESYRGRKIATALLNELLKYGREKLGIKDFTLEVRSKNAAAIKLYENAGFKKEGVRYGFYDKPQDDAVIMWLRGNEGGG